MVNSETSTDRAWQVLGAVLDPEVPVLSIVELGIVREVEATENTVMVTLTPTYSGCPAMDMIRANIESELRNAGWHLIEIRTQLSPAWTTDWMSEASRAKLRQYGIAPPLGSSNENLVPFPGSKKIPCPYCQGAGLVKSTQTMAFEILSEARRISKQVGGQADDVTLRVSPDVAQAFRTTEAAIFEEIEAHFTTPVRLKVDHELHQEQFDFAIL